MNCPVRLIHGLSDEEVPMDLALKLLQNCASRDSAITLLKRYCSLHCLLISRIDTHIFPLRSCLSLIFDGGCSRFMLACLLLVRACFSTSMLR